MVYHSLPVQFSNGNCKIILGFHSQQERVRSCPNFFGNIESSEKLAHGNIVK